MALYRTPRLAKVVVGLLLGGVFACSSNATDGKQASGDAGSEGVATVDGGGGDAGKDGGCCSEVEGGPKSVPDASDGAASSAPCSAIVDFVVTSTSPTSIALSWTGALGVTVQVGRKSYCAAEAYVTLATLPAGSTSYTDTSVQTDWAYWYEIVASDGSAVNASAVLATQASSVGVASCSAGVAAQPSGVSTSTCSATGDSGAPPADDGGAPPLVDSAAPTAPAFYVATDGDDSNLGTSVNQAFATLAKAQQAMQASSSIKTTYLRAGTYQPAVTGGNCVWGNSAGSSIGLGAADDGETWSYYPPDGYGTAILDGQSTVGESGGGGGNGTGCAFGASGATNVTIVGLQFERYLFGAVWGYQTSNFTFADNVVHDTTACSFASAAVILTASPGSVIRNNYLYNLAYIGLAIDDTSSAGDSMSNTTVANNVIINGCTWPVVSNGGNDQNGGDCAGIYIWSKVPSVSTNIQVTNNYVEDLSVSSGGKGDWGSGNCIGIYMDDGADDVTVSGNVVTGIKSSCFLIHGGHDNIIEANLCDLSASGPQEIVFYQNDGFGPMTGNVFQDNVVVAGSTSSGAGFLGSNSPPNPLTIKNNAYFNYVGSSVNSNGPGNAGNDSNPTYENPNVSCWAAGLASGSPVFGAPVNFPGIKGGFGPPGFALPQTGTPPSWPHGC